MFKATAFLFILNEKHKLSFMEKSVWKVFIASLLFGQYKRATELADNRNIAKVMIYGYLMLDEGKSFK